MTYTYEWPQASPCSNVILYTLTPFLKAGEEDQTMVSMLVTKRDASVGEGRSLSAGGFDEVKDTFNRAGEMIDGCEETYREMCEELGEEIKTIIPYDDFKRRVEYLWDGMVPKEQAEGEDFPLVEKVVFRALEITQDQMRAIMALPDTAEQKGKMEEHFVLNDDKAEPVNSQIVEKALTGFKYQHEVEAAKMLYEKLERHAKLHAPTKGCGW